MAKLPVISGLKAVKAFNKAGWVVSRQTRNHVIMEKGSIRTQKGRFERVGGLNGDASEFIPSVARMGLNI